MKSAHANQNMDPLARLMNSYPTLRAAGYAMRSMSRTMQMNPQASTQRSGCAGCLELVLQVKNLTRCRVLAVPARQGSTRLTGGGASLVALEPLPTDPLMQIASSVDQEVGKRKSAVSLATSALWVGIEVQRIKDVRCASQDFSLLMKATKTAIDVRLARGQGQWHQSPASSVFPP